MRSGRKRSLRHHCERRGWHARLPGVCSHFWRLSPASLSRGAPGWMPAGDRWSARAGRYVGSGKCASLRSRRPIVTHFLPCVLFSFSLSQIYCIENAHGQLVRDLDFNPNKQYYLASCGDDCKVKFWDTRNVTEPVKTLEEHSHW